MEFQAKVRKNLEDSMIEVKNDFDKVIGYLQLISEKDAHNVDLINKFTEWRKRHALCFHTCFEAKPERTKKWILESVLQDDNKVFFKILNSQAELVGHVAAINRKEYIEYDNLIRGEPIDVPNFIYFVELTFMRWIFNISTTPYIFGRCLSPNTKVLRLHEKTGFKISNKIPLERISDINGECSWKEALNDTNAEEYTIEIKLHREEMTLSPITLTGVKE